MKTRMNQDLRSRAKRLGRQTLVCAEEAEAERAAHLLLLNYVQGRIAALVPEDERRVLTRHNCFEYRDFVTVTSTNESSGRRSGVVVSRFPRVVDGARHNTSWATSNYNYKERNALAETMFGIPLSWAHRAGDGMIDPSGDAALCVHIDTYISAAEKHDRARAKVLDALGHIIDTAKTLDDLAEAWPPAKALLSSTKLLPVVVSSEVIRTLAAATFAEAPSGDVE